MPPHRILSAKEIAARHAVSDRTVRALAERGELPADKIGRQYRFDAEEVAVALRLSRSGKNGK